MAREGYWSLGKKDGRVEDDLGEALEKISLAEEMLGEVVRRMELPAEGTRGWRNPQGSPGTRLGGGCGAKSNQYVPKRCPRKGYCEGGGSCRGQRSMKY